MSSSFARASAVFSSIVQVFSYLSCLAVYSLLNVLIILNSLCHRLINLGDFT